MARKLIKKKKANRSVFGDAGVFIFLCLIGAFMVLPLIYVVSNAFKPLDEIFQFPPRFFVRNPTPDNFSDLFTLMADSWVPFSRYIFNTVFITAVGTFCHVIVASLAAFALEKIDMPGSKGIFKLVVISLMFTGAVTGIPNYLIMANLHLLDTPYAILLPAIGGTLGLFLMKQFMSSVPDVLMEAATVDGANRWIIFWKIVMPQVKPAWLTLVIFVIQNLWNATGGIFIYSEQKKTLPYALSQILAGGIARQGVGSAVALFMLIVPIGTFILTQSNIIETMASSGIKE